MKKLASLIALAPAAAFAHGGHAELPPAVHDGWHGSLAIAVALIVAALLVGWQRSRRQ